MPFQKGHPGYKKPGTKNGTTLIMEERKARFDEKVSQKWDKIIDKLAEQKPEYVANQFIGKPKETIDHNISVNAVIALLPPEDERSTTAAKQN